MFTHKYIYMQTCSHFYLIYQPVVLMIYNMRRFEALCVAFNDEWLLMISEKRRANKERDEEEKEEEEDIRQ